MRGKPIKDREGFLAIEGTIFFIVIPVMDQIPHDVLFATVEPRTKILHQMMKGIVVTDEEVRG